MPTCPLPSPQWALSQTFARQREHWALVSARSEGLRGQREERDMFPQPRPVDCDHCPPLSSSGWSWSGIETGTMATEARCECSLREFAAICPSIGDRVGRVRLARVLLYYGWVGRLAADNVQRLICCQLRKRRGVDFCSHGKVLTRGFLRHGEARQQSGRLLSTLQFGREPDRAPVCQAGKVAVEPALRLSPSQHEWHAVVHREHR